MFQSLCSAATSRSSFLWSIRLQTAGNSCLFVTYATSSLQFLLCFDNECLLLDLKLYVIKVLCCYFFFVHLPVRIFYGHPKDPIIMNFEFYL